MLISMKSLNGKNMAKKILDQMGEKIDERDKAIEAMIGAINSYLTENVVYFAKSKVNQMEHKYKVLVNINLKFILEKTASKDGDTLGIAFKRLGKAIEEEINKTPLLSIDSKGVGTLKELNYMKSTIKLKLSGVSDRKIAIEKLATDICKGISALPSIIEMGIFISSAQQQQDSCKFES